MAHRKYEGVVTATILPFDGSGGIDEGSLRHHVSDVVSGGAAGVAVNVDAGEGPLLSPDERLTAIRIVASEVGDSAFVVAGLNASGTEDAITQARRSEEAGADALLVYPSPVFRGDPLPIDIPVEYFSRIAEATNLDLLIFQLHEVLGGVLYSDEHLIAICRVPRVVGMKEASFDAGRFLRTLRALRANAAGTSVLSGNDFFLYESYVLGADGALISFANLVVPLQVELFRLTKARRYEEAALLAQRLDPLLEAVFRPPLRNYRSRLKQALVALGTIESARVRAPLRDAGREEGRLVIEALAAVTAEIGGKSGTVQKPVRRW